MDLHRICELGQEGVLLLLADSTNVEKPGYTMSEKTVGAGLDDLFRTAGNSRIIVATYHLLYLNIQVLLQHLLHLP